MWEHPPSFLQVTSGESTNNPTLCSHSSTNSKSIFWEVGSAHNPVRRNAKSKDALVSQLFEGIYLVDDVLFYAARAYGSKDALGARRNVDIHEEEEKVKRKVDGEEADLLAANETEHYKDGGDGDEYNEDDDASPSEEPMDSDAIDNEDFGKKKSPKKTHVLQSLTNESGRKSEPNHLTKPRTGVRRNGRTAQTRKVRMGVGGRFGSCRENRTGTYNWSR